MVFIVTNVKKNVKRDTKLSHKLGPLIAKCFKKEPHNTMVSVNSGINTKVAGMDGEFLIVRIQVTDD